MGKLGRSASLVGFGLLFLLGGWQLERLRRKLVAHMTAGGAS
jgi:cytochrome oxidase assembly protein ShyY1